MFGSFHFSAYYFGAWITSATGSGSPDHLHGKVWAVPYLGGEVDGESYLRGETSSVPYLGGGVSVN